MDLLLDRVRSSTIFIFTVSFLFIFPQKSLSQGLRPSDHGLQYQSSSPPTESHSPMSFFGDSPPPSPQPLLPKASEADGDDDTWWRDGAANRRDHVMRHVFLAASIICGVSGVALLGVFALVYFFRCRKQEPPNLPL